MLRFKAVLLLHVRGRLLRGVLAGLRLSSAEKRVVVLAAYSLVAVIMGGGVSSVMLAKLLGLLLALLLVLLRLLRLRLRPLVVRLAAVAAMVAVAALH
jgi:hypothetical protein